MSTTSPQGSRVMVLRIPDLIPPDADTNFPESNVNPGTLRVKLAADEAIYVTIDIPDGTSHVVRTPKVKFVGRGVCLLICTWDFTQSPPAITININGQNAKEIPGAEQPIQVSLKGGLENPDPIPSYMQVGASNACKDWVHYRSTNLNRWETLRQGRIKRTDDEVLGQLRDAHARLTDLKTMISAGRRHHLQGIIAEMRAMLYWDDRPNTSYTPLLLRVAARKSLPLPMFWVKDILDPTAPQIVKDAEARTSGFNWSLSHTMEFEELIDLQEALTRTAQIDLVTSVGVTTTRRILVKDVLIDAAVTNSAAHYDIGTTERLYSFESMIQDALPRLLFTMTSIVLSLTTYVLGAASR